LRKLITSLVIGVLLMYPATSAIAATSQDVTVTATPSFISISNTPGSYDFGLISESGTPNTGTGHFTVTNTSTVDTDISIGCDGWSGGASPWTYGASAADTARLLASATQGGTGGSGGAGSYDVTAPSGSTALLCDGLTASTGFAWELQLEAPSSFGHGDQQTTTVTITAVVD
jgi:hypothetical protein